MVNGRKRLDGALALAATSSKNQKNKTASRQNGFTLFRCLRICFKNIVMTKV